MSPLSCTALIVAGGCGSRLGAGRPKQYLPLAGRPLLVWTLEAFERCPEIRDVVLVTADSWREPAAELLRPYPLTKLLRICAGGARRVDSVRAGLAALPDHGELVAIHDGARPLVTPALISRVVQAAAASGAALPLVPVSDTVKQVHQAKVQRTLDRSPLQLAQTPQVFAVELIRRAFARLDPKSAASITDDAQLVELLGAEVQAVPGDPHNFKVTRAEDLRRAHELLHRAQGEPMTAIPVRTGHGYDVHRLVPGRALLLGGVRIEGPVGLLGHSDADVLCHAVGDALLGAAALGDLGQHFPPSDDSYRDISSLLLLEHIVELVASAGLVPGNVDTTVVCQRPRLAPHVPAMRENLARVLGLPQDRVSVKATTTEGLGPAGRGEGIEAHAVVLLCSEA